MNEADRIRIRIGGVDVVQRCESLEISRSLQAVAGVARLELPTTRIGSGLRAKPGDSFTVEFDGHKMMTGYVDAFRESFDADQHTAEITARDKTGDLVDSSSILEPGEYRHQSLNQIATLICGPFGITVEVASYEGTYLRDRFEQFAIEPGESAFAALERACRLRGALPYTTGDGVLVIGQPGTSRAEADLIEGQNVARWDVTDSHADRFALYLIRGQRPGDDFNFGTAVAAVEGRAEDPEVGRYRPLLVLAEGNVTESTAQQRAEWEASVRAARSAQLRVVAKTWRQTVSLDESKFRSLPIWEINSRVAVQSETLALSTLLLIDSVSYRFDGSGTSTELLLVRPDAYTVEATVKRDNEPFRDLFGDQDVGSAGQLW